MSKVYQFSGLRTENKVVSFHIKCAAYNSWPSFSLRGQSRAVTYEITVRIPEMRPTTRQPPPKKKYALIHPIPQYTYLLPIAP